MRKVYADDAGVLSEDICVALQIAGLSASVT